MTCIYEAVLASYGVRVGAEHAGIDSLAATGLLPNLLWRDIPVLCLRTENKLDDLFDGTAIAFRGYTRCLMWQ